jgi:hypothetical protein
MFLITSKTLRIVLSIDGKDHVMSTQEALALRKALYDEIGIVQIQHRCEKPYSNPSIRVSSPELGLAEKLSTGIISHPAETDGNMSGNLIKRS